MRVEVKNNNIVVAHSDVHKGLLHNVWVEPDYRGRGYGYQLISECTRSFKNLYLYVNKDNEAALHIYIKNGFKIKETLKLKDKTVYKMEFRRN